MKFLFHIIILSIFVSACAVPSSPPPPSPEPSNILTLGTVQSKIRKGMSQAEVLSCA